MRDTLPGAPPLLRLFDIVPHALCVTDAGGVVRMANPAVARLMGARGEVEGTAIADLAVPEDRTLFLNALASVDTARPHCSTVIRFRLPEGVRRVRCSITLDPESQARYVVAWDVTDKHLTEARYRAATEASPTALVLVGADGRIVMANPAALRMLGYRSEELVGEPVEVLVPGPYRGAHPGHRSSFHRAPSARPMGRGRDLFVQTRDGTLVPVEIGLNPVDVDGETLAVVSLVDLTERREATQRIEALAAELGRANRELRRLAVTDPLTGLWNRRKFFEEAERALGLLQQTGGPLSVVMLDVDRFKSFNDRFGHPAGDRVLRKVAAVLADARAGSDIVARYGGEEFVVALPGADADGARAVAERIREGVAGLAGEAADVTISAGISTLADAGERGVPVRPLLDRVVNAADRALYRAKAAGRNRVE